MSELIVKSLQSNITDADEKSGIIKGYANVYNVKDSHGDISAVGSFTKTVSEQKDWIRIYKNHDKKLFVGVPAELDASDPYGLNLTAKFIMETELGRDTFNEAKFLHDNGFKAGFSIGGYIVNRDKTNKSIVKEYKIDDISILTLEPSNKLSYAEMFKSIQESETPNVNDFFAMVEKAYNDKGFSDTYLQSLENTLKSLTTEPSGPTETTLEVEPTTLITNIYSNFI